jgi:hypothetical protein
MDWPTFIGATVGSFIFPAAAFWIFLRMAAGPRGIRWGWLVSGWAIGCLLIYASTIPAGRGFLASLTLGHVLALLLAVWLTIRVFRIKRQAPSAA